MGLGEGSGEVGLLRSPRFCTEIMGEGVAIASKKASSCDRTTPPIHLAPSAWREEGRTVQPSDKIASLSDYI